ncbi:DUF3352 domain-containing protein [Lyngbya aestuarii]|uniref:DUF3352 domain-containing protein n=1 Tax=Lyngbya aestuarii TaxID=118322 RepID=UPI00403D667E
MLEKKKSYRLLTLGAVVLLVSGGLAVYWLLLQRHLFQGDTVVSTQLVPQNALVTASISTDAAQWQQVRQYGTRETKAALDKQLKSLQEQLLKANGYNYQEDIKPWLGEAVMIAYLPSAALTTPEDAESLLPKRSWIPDLMILPMKNPVEAKQLLAKAKSRPEKPLVERAYKGIRILETQNNNSQNYSVAVVKDFLVVTKNAKITDYVIDTYQGSPSIAATPGYTKAVSKIDVAQPFAQVYLNMPAILEAAAVNSRREFSAEEIAAQQPSQGILTKITLEPEGMLFNSISWLKPNSTKKYRLDNKASNLPRTLPANTLLMLSGNNLSRLWQDYAQGAESNPLKPIQPEVLSGGLKTTLGLDLEEDLLPWMGGEFVVALIPASKEEAIALPENQPSSPLGAGVVLMVQASNRSRAEKSLQKLDQAVANRYQFLVEETKLNDQSVVRWESPLGGLSASHGWLEDKVAFLTLGAPITSVLIPQPQAILPQTPLFQKAVPTKPDPNNGQLFLDVERTINNSNLNLPQLPPQQQMLAKAIRAIGLTSATNDERSTRFELFVQLKTTNPINPSPSPESTVSPAAEDNKPSPKPTLSPAAEDEKPQTPPPASPE